MEKCFSSISKNVLLVGILHLKNHRHVYVMEMFVFSESIQLLNSLYDVEAASLVVEPRHRVFLLTHHSHHIQILLAVKRKLLKPVSTGHVSYSLEVTPRLHAFLQPTTQTLL